MPQPETIPSQTMDFFAHQDAAKRRTGWLLVLFGLAVLFIIAAVHLLVAAVLHRQGLANPGLFAINAGAALGVILLGVIITALGVSSSGKSVAEACGGTQVLPDTNDPDERRLLNVVEEMSLASGVPVPPVFVMEDEPGLNAFAAGSSPGDAAIAVTEGALKRFTRDELQGVIAHEYSHILNGDMRLNLRLASWLGGIMGLAVLGETMVRILWHTGTGRRRRSSFGTTSGGGKKDNTAGIIFAIFLIGVGLYLIGWIGVFFARLIQAAVSRQREFLADASAVQFTRNPGGLAAALKKIAGGSGSAIRHPQAKLFRHLFFARGNDDSIFDFLLATHPPIAERIALIDPTFKPAQLEEEAAPDPNVLVQQISATARESAQARSFIGQVGRPRPAGLQHAHELLVGLPDAVLKGAHDPYGASALVLGLLLSTDDAVRRQQLEDLENTASQPLRYELRRLLPHFASIERSQKLPLVELCIGALRQLNPLEHQRFRDLLDHLIASDGFLDLFEFTLQKMIRRHLDTAFQPAAPPVVAFRQLEDLQTECVVLLSCLTHQGHPGNPAVATKAYRTGMALLNLDGASDDPLPANLCKLDALEAALDKLALASFGLKKFILTACVTVTGFDHSLTPAESELLRAISDTFDCPVPL